MKTSLILNTLTDPKVRHAIVQTVTCTLFDELTAISLDFTSIHINGDRLNST